MKFVLVFIVFWLAACASTSTPGPHAAVPGATRATATPGAAPGASGAPAAPGSAASAVPPRATLAAEQQRLSTLFQGTPVVFALQADGSLRVDVPLDFCFDRNAFAVKAPLAAVLDRLARSQRGDIARLRVTASGDTATSSPNLARDRAASVRDYMVARGVSAARVVVAAGAPGEGIEIVVSEPARR